MRTRVDSILRDEAARFSLRFACEDCVHWVASGVDRAPLCGDSPSVPGAAGVCANGWPERVAKDALSGDEVAFCKEFELGARD